MSEFSDRPFVAGSLFGLRAFRIDMLGRLTGITHKDVWTPGENEAVCHMESRYARGGLIFPSTALHQYITWGTSGTVTFNSTPDAEPRHTPRGKKSKKKWIPPTPTPAEKAAAVMGVKAEPQVSEVPAKPEHTVASVGCACGFYAYFDGANDYLRDTAVSTGGYYISFGDDDTAPRVGAIVEGWGVCTVGSRGFRASKARIVGLIAPTSQSARYAIAFDKVQRNYGAPVFDTEFDAITAYPLTDPFPADPTAEDFWTRSAR